MVPSALVTFSSDAGKLAAVPLTWVVEASWYTITFRLAVIPGVRNRGPGDSGFFSSCWMLIIGVPFASRVPEAVGKPNVAVFVETTFPFTIVVLGSA